LNIVSYNIIILCIISLVFIQVGQVNQYQPVIGIVIGVG
jgi:hypothetical protein